MLGCAFKLVVQAVQVVECFGLLGFLDYLEFQVAEGFRLLSCLPC